MSSDYFDAFIREGQEQITELNNALLALEDDPDDTETMDDIFRSAHTLKGNFAAMGYDDASELAHAVEDMLDEMREGNMAVTADRMDLIFEGVDELEAILDEIEAEGDNSIDPSGLVEDLRGALDDGESDDGGDAGGGTGAVPEGSFDATATEGLLSVLDDTASLAAYDGTVYHVRVRVKDRGMKGADGMMALQGVSQYDLVAAHPPQEAIEDGDYEGAFDIFVGGGDAAAVESGLSGQQSVESIRLRDATEQVAALEPAPAGGTGDASPDADPDDADQPQAEPATATSESIDAGTASEAPDDPTPAEEPAVEETAAVTTDAGGATDAVDSAGTAATTTEPTTDAGTTTDRDPTGDRSGPGSTGGGGAADPDPEPAAGGGTTPTSSGGGVSSRSTPDESEREENGGRPGPLARARLAIGGVFASLATAFGATAGGSTNGTNGTAPHADARDTNSGAGPETAGGTGDGEAVAASPGGDPVSAPKTGGAAGESAAPASTDDAATATTGAASTDGAAETDSEPDGNATGDGGTTAEDGSEAGGDTDFVTGPDTPDLDPSDVESATTDSASFSTESSSGTAITDEADDDDDWGWDDEDDEVTDDGDGTTDDGDGAGGFDPDPDDGGGGDGGGGDGGGGGGDDDSDADDEITSSIDDIKSVRVDVDQLDDLYGQVEQLVTSRIKLRKALENAEVDVEKDLDELDKTTSSLQDTVMDMRLVPMKKIVGKFPRVVRDLSREQDKEVDFTMEGTDVELDRTILDRLSDPLIHILRNAVDHGIEPPAEREAKGKPREGSITLEARRERDRAIIQVSDDGGGLDAEKIRQKAFEQGIRPTDELEQMDDDSIYDLIFHPGFSTTDEVTDVSGRGVGMDVVHNTVTRLDGSVNVESEDDEGTTVTLELPVSIAIVKVLFVEVGDHQFGVPIKKIDKVSQFSGTETVNGQEMIERDDDLFKVIHLHEALDTVVEEDHGPVEEDEEGMLIRVRRDERPVALYCDAVSDQEEVVVKPLEGVLSGTPGLSGTAVLGEGNVVPVLDVKTI